MKAESIPAIHEDGVLKPLEPLDLPEHERVYITIESSQDQARGDLLAPWKAIYEGLGEEEIAELEAIVLKRDTFMRQDNQ